MTIFYQLLIDLPSEYKQEEILDYFSGSFYTIPQENEKHDFIELINNYMKRRKKNDISEEESRAKMKNANPRFVLRNYLLHQAIEELEKGESDLFEKLRRALKDPYSKKYDEFFAKRPDWASKKAGCSMLSCSS